MECGLLGGGVPLKFGHDVLEVGKVHQKFSGSLFEHCELSFGCSKAVQIVVGAVKNVSEFLDGVEVDSIVDDVGVDHSVSVAFEKGRVVHHLGLVVAGILGVAYQFHL